MWCIRCTGSVCKQAHGLCDSAPQILDSGCCEETLDCNVIFFIVLHTFTHVSHAYRYKNYKDALRLASKSNSLAGATAEQVAQNRTSLAVLQLQKCPSFEAFDLVFGHTPGVKPVTPMEIGSMQPAMADSNNAPALDAEVTGGGGGVAEAFATRNVAETFATRNGTTGIIAPNSVSAAAIKGAVATGKAAGNAAAPFHLAPSRKEPKMDLGEAYLKAQELKIGSATEAARSKNRCDLIVALTLQGKTAADIADFLNLVGM